MSKTRCLLYISGLDPTKHWEHALTHFVGLQNRLALPGRNTPYQYQFGQIPDISHIRIFGCAALAYVEKDKRHKLDFKPNNVSTSVFPHVTHMTHTHYYANQLTLSSIDETLASTNAPFLPESTPLPGI